MRYILGITSSLVLLFFAASCAGPVPGDRPKNVPREALTWPRPPDEPRIRYVRSVRDPYEWGIAKSFFQRILDTLGGTGEKHFVRPTGVAERNGVLYVADPGARCVWIVDAARNRLEDIFEVGNATLVSPVALAVRPDGAVYVVDSSLKKVFLLDRDGKLIRIAAEQALERPSALGYDAPMSELYVADSATDRINVYDSNGALIRTWGRSGNQNGEFNRPTHLAIDSTGTVLVNDALNFRIQAFDRTARFLWKFGHHGDGSGDFAAPKGIASDSTGHVYIVDALFDAIQIFDRDGTLLLAFGEHGTEPGQFWLPSGVFINAQDEIYVADAYNQRVQVFHGGRSLTKTGND